MLQVMRIKRMSQKKRMNLLLIQGLLQNPKKVLGGQSILLDQYKNAYSLKGSE